MTKRNNEQKAPKLSDAYVIRKVRLEELNIDAVEDGGYQRGDKPNMKRIAADFNKAAAGVLHVGNRGEAGLWLIDGRQRRGGMLINGIKEWDAVVLPSSGREYEAGIYAMLNGKDRKGLTKMELFQGQLAAKDPIALAVVRACQSVGWHIKASKGGSRYWGEISCVGTLYRECGRKSGGEELLTRTLKLIEKCWPQQNDCMIDVVIGGFCQFVRTFGDSVSEEHLANVLATVPPRKAILDSATATGNKTTEFMRVLVGLYNRKARGKAKLKLVGAAEDAA